MGMPGWPERAFSTASTARNRIVFAACVASVASVRVGALTRVTLHLPPPGARPTLAAPRRAARRPLVNPATPSLSELSQSELRRYGRHLTLAEVGEEGQKR